MWIPYCFLCPTEFKLLPEEIERWFTKIDHIFEHTRIRHEEVLTAFDKTSVDKMQRRPFHVASHINYKYDLLVKPINKIQAIISFYFNMFFLLKTRFCYIHLSFNAIGYIDIYRSMWQNTDSFGIKFEGFTS